MLELLKGKYRAKVSSDRRCFTIEKYTKTKWKVTGQVKEGWRDLGKFPDTLESLLKIYQKQRIMDKLEGDEIVTLKQIAQEIKNIKKEIEDVLSIGKDGLIKEFKPSDIPISEDESRRGRKKSIS